MQEGANVSEPRKKCQMKFSAQNLVDAATLLQRGRLGGCTRRRRARLLFQRRLRFFDLAGFQAPDRREDFLKRGAVDLPDGQEQTANNRTDDEPDWPEKKKPAE